MIWFSLLILMAASCVAFVMALLTLPGVWFLLLVAGLLQWWGHAIDRVVFNPTILYIAIGMALLGEVLEFISSAIGSKKAGGGKPAGYGAIIGATVGALVGTLFVPPLGTILGSIFGAGLGALILERGMTKSSVTKSMQVALGAAAGRLVATAIKLGILLVIAGKLLIALFVRAVFY